MTYKLACCPLFRSLVTSSLLLAGCAQSAIESLDDDASLSNVEADAAPEEDADEPPPEEDADAPAEVDAGHRPVEDAGSPSQDAAPRDAGNGGALDAGAAAPDAAAPDSAAPIDAGQDAARDAAVDAAPPRDAAPADAATPPVDTGPPPPKCTAGSYRGTFMGSVAVQVFGLDITTIPLMGTITLTAVADGADRFNVTNGAVTGTDDANDPITARVTGTMNCATGKLENGKLEDGKYIHWLVGEILFTGSVSGTYTNTPPSANGNWQTETASTTLLRSGMGTWNVSHVP
jgi:hypothetical protein